MQPLIVGACAGSLQHLSKELTLIEMMARITRITKAGGWFEE